MMREVRERIGRHPKLLAGCAAAMVTVGIFAVWAHTAQAGSVGPDVTVIYLGQFGSCTSNYGSVGGIRAYSLSTTSCNVGDAPLWWCNDTGPGECDADHDNVPDVGPEKHPVIAQNLYRLKDGRFEQLGMSWLKHGFLSTNSFDPACGSCQGPPAGGDQLGVGCTDTYGSSLNGGQPLGKRSEVSATTGVFPYPYTQVPTPTVIDQRIQVAETELDPTLNAGARYWVEGHYIASDDAEANNAFNNASHREVTVASGTFNLTCQGSTVREQPALFAWKAVDPEVDIIPVDIPGSDPIERFYAARRVSTALGGGWHYEYAIFNMNSDRAAQSFTVAFPGPVSFSSVGFHDVDHHSGEPYATTDWGTNVNGPAGTITWFTDTFATDPNANALRWSTMFSFWFDADASPADLTHTLGLFEPGKPSSVEIPFGNSIFTDGFESGNLSGWSGVVPPP